MPQTLLAISGSLRAASSNTALLRVAAGLAPAQTSVELWDGLGEIPPFSPDREGQETAAVLDFRARVKAAAGVLISSPEYAHGVPGSLKNALDWLVGSGEFVGKPFALLSASPRATYVKASLIETLTTMDAVHIAEATMAIQLAGNMDEAAILGRPDAVEAIQRALHIFSDEIQK